MSTKRLSYTAEQIDDAIAKKDLLKDVSSVNATPDDVSELAKIVGPNGLQQGTVPTLPETTYQFTTEDQVIKENTMLVGDQIIKPLLTQSKTASIDCATQEIVPDEGKTLDRVIVNRIQTDAIGSDYEEVPDQTIIPTVHNIDIVPQGVTNRYLRNNKVIIRGDSNLKSENIRVGKTIFGVEGSYESDPNMRYPASDGKEFNSYGLIGNHHWADMAYGNAKCVAVDENDAIVAISNDGINWTITELDNGNLKMNTICYGNGKFIGIVKNTTIGAYSTDGVNWNLSSLPASKTWSSVCYGGGKYVVVGLLSSIALYSEDGITWKQSALPAESDWSDVCYGNGLYVAVSSATQPAVLAYSTDAINWYSVTLGSEVEGSFSAVTFGNNKFVVLSKLSSTFLYSTNAINWTRRSISYAAWNCVTYGNGRFVAVSDAKMFYNYSAYSDDGVTWTQVECPKDCRWVSVVYNGERYVTVGPNDSTGIESVYTENGSKWESVSSINSSITWASIAYGNNVYCAIGNGSTSALMDGIAYSYNGIDWRSSKITGNIKWRSIAYGNGRFVAVGDNLDSINDTGLTPIAVSFDGVTWVQLNITEFNDKITFNYIKYGGNKFLACGENIYATSLDGITWSSTSTASTSWIGCAYGKNTYIMITNSTISYSSDCINWQLATTPSSIKLKAATYGNNKFVAVGTEASNQSKFLSLCSTDGVTWSSNSTALQAVSMDINSACYGNGKYIAVGAGTSQSVALYSTDGLNWEQCKVNSTSALVSVCYTNNKFIALGTTPAITLNSYTTLDYSDDLYNKLVAPSLTISGSKVSINPVANASTYEVIILTDSKLITMFTTTNLNIDMTLYAATSGTYKILARACGAGYMPSECVLGSYQKE